MEAEERSDCARAVSSAAGNGMVARVVDDLNITPSSTFREVTSALNDAFKLAMRPEDAEALIRNGVLEEVLCALNAPQFNDRAAQVSVPGAVLEMRRVAMMALASLTVRSLRRANRARMVPGLLPCVIRVLKEDYASDALLALWGCGTLANLVQGCVIKNIDMRQEMARTFVGILRTSADPRVLDSALITARILGASSEGLESLKEAGLGEPLYARIRSLVPDPPTGFFVHIELLKELALTQACLARRSVPVPVPSASKQPSGGGDAAAAAGAAAGAAAVGAAAAAAATATTSETKEDDGSAAAGDGSAAAGAEKEGKEEGKAAAAAGATTGTGATTSAAGAAAGTTAAPCTCDGSMRPQYYRVGRQRFDTEWNFHYFCNECALRAHDYIFGPLLFDNVACERYGQPKREPSKVGGE